MDQRRRAAIRAIVVQGAQAAAKCRSFTERLATGAVVDPAAHPAPWFTCGDCACVQCGPLYGARGHVKNAVRTAVELAADPGLGEHRARLDVIARVGRVLLVSLHDVVSHGRQVTPIELQTSWRAWARLVNEFGYEVLSWGSGPGYAYHTAFVSHAGEEQDVADELVARLEARGVRCFLARRDLRAGAALSADLEERVRWYDRTLALLSPTSVRKDWVCREVSLSLLWELNSGSAKLIPLRLCEADLISPERWSWPHPTLGDIARLLAERLILDFREEAREDAIERILAELACG